MWGKSPTDRFLSPVAGPTSNPPLWGPIYLRIFLFNIIPLRIVFDLKFEIEIDFFWRCRIGIGTCKSPNEERN